MTAARDRLAVALDVASVSEAERLIGGLRGRVGVFKIGYQLAYAGGLDLARDLAAEGERVFLDLKLLDIGNTVARGVESVTRLGVEYLTVHGYPHAMRAAVEGRGGSPLKLVAITVLTSLDGNDLRAAGYECGLDDLVFGRARAAAEIGFDAVVASAREAERLKRVAVSLAVVTPGIRPAGVDANDQKRAATPAQAIGAGADLLVVGRPITRSSDPAAAADAIVEEIERALHEAVPAAGADRSAPG